MARQRAFIISGDQRIPADRYLLKVVGTDSVGLARINQRSLFSDQP